MFDKRIPINYKTLAQLRRRFGKNYLRQRLLKEHRHSALQFRGGFKFFWENIDSMAPLLKAGLRVTGLHKRGLNNALDYEVIHHTVPIHNLPKTLHNFTILQLTDLHADGILDQGTKLSTLLKGLRYDACVFTGDYRFLTYGQIHESLTITRRLVQSLDASKPRISILGNHDTLEMIPALEAMGLKTLVNENTYITRGQDRLGILGVDDPHFYEMDDLDGAQQGLGDCAATILLAHSQELIETAAADNIHLYLCGHTHGGQICLPGGRAVIKNTPKRYHPFITGPWTYGTMQGYTPRGVGCSSVTVRFNCRPEITLHKLIPASPSRNP